MKGNIMPQAIRFTDQTLARIEDISPEFAERYTTEEKHQLIADAEIFVWRPVVPPWRFIIMNEQSFMEVYGRVPEEINTQFVYVYPQSLKTTP